MDSHIGRTSMRSISKGRQPRNLIQPRSCHYDELPPSKTSKIKRKTKNFERAQAMFGLARHKWAVHRTARQQRERLNKSYDLLLVASFIPEFCHLQDWRLVWTKCHCHFYRTRLIAEPSGHTLAAIGATRVLPLCEFVKLLK